MKITRIEAIWCGGCLAMKKIWKELEKEYSTLDITVYDYDIDEDEVKKLDVGTVLPVIIFSKDNKEIRLIGEQSKKEIINVLEKM